MNPVNFLHTCEIRVLRGGLFCLLSCLLLPYHLYQLWLIVFLLERRLRVCQARDISKHSQPHLTGLRVRVHDKDHCGVAKQMKVCCLQGEDPQEILGSVYLGNRSRERFAVERNSIDLAHSAAECLPEDIQMTAPPSQVAVTPG